MAKRKTVVPFHGTAEQEKALRELERDGLVTRREYLEVPVRVEYSPTEDCRELLPILEQLSDWAEKRM